MTPFGAGWTSPRGPDEQMRIKKNWGSLNVLDQGEGQPVLLLHGFPDSSRLWRHQVPALVRAGYRVIIPDLRGFGESDMPESIEAYAMRALVGDVVDVLDCLEVDRATVVGHDWGATLGWVFAASKPQRVERLVVLANGHPNGYATDALVQQEKSWYVPLFLSCRAEEALRRDGWQLMRRLCASHPDLDQVLADLDRPGALRGGLSWYRANVRPERFGSGNPTYLGPAACPVLGVWASDDGFLTEAQMIASAQHVKGPWRYERLDGVGHWIPLEAPDRLNALLLEFIRACVRT